MRRLVVIGFVSLDGVMQGLGSSDEDRVGGFEHGGWAAPYFDEVQQQAAINRTPTHGRPSQRDRQIRSHSDGYSVHLVRHRTTRGTRDGAVGELKAGGVERSPCLAAAYWSRS